MLPEELPEINLLPKFERQSSRLFYGFIITLIVTLLAYAFIGYFYFSTKSKLETTQEEYSELSEVADQLQAQVDVRESGGSDLDHAVAFADNHNIPTSILIEELVERLPDHSYLTEYDYGSHTVNITNHFETLDIVSNYTSELLQSDYIKDTKVDSVDTFTIKDEAEQVDPLKFIPRYEANFTLEIDKRNLKGAFEEDE